MSVIEDTELPLVQFLKNSKLKLEERNHTEAVHVHVVLGNEACDLDSAVSAIVYAYILYKKCANSEELFVPVLNIASTEYRIRTEVAFALQLHKVTQDILVFRDQIDLKGLHDEKKLSLILVDFNVLRGEDKYLEGSVHQILDHRKKEIQDNDRIKMTIEPVGSCCTLVTEVMESNPELSVPHDIHWLLYGTILLDTVCLSESAGRTTPKDIQYIDVLEAKLQKTDRQSVFNKLQNAKLDVSGLTSVEVLKKDLKTVTENNIIVAMSSIPLQIQEFVSREDLQSSLSVFSTQQGAALVVIMALYLDHQGEPHRQLAVYSADNALRGKLADGLQTVVEPGLDLIETVGTAWPHIATFDQGNVKASRKVILPLVTGLLGTMDILDECSPSQGGDNQNNSCSDTLPTLMTDEPLISEEGTLTLEDERVSPVREVSSVNDTLNDNNGASTEKVSVVDMAHDKVMSDTNKDLLDPLAGQTNILLEITPNSTPASGLSSFSPSPSHGSTENLSVYSSNEPITPSTTPMEQDISDDSPSKIVELPSFHSLEMVKKIRDKKASYVDEVSTEAVNYPYTPVNSFADLGNMDKVVQDRNLPSFHSADMVQKIKKKKVPTATLR